MRPEKLSTGTAGLGEPKPQLKAINEFHWVVTGEPAQFVLLK